jgi:hypothetical protein
MGFFVKETLPASLFFVGSFVLGTAITIPAVYAVGCAIPFPYRVECAVFAVTLGALVLSRVGTKKKREREPLTFPEMGFFLFAFCFSSYIMLKSFRGYQGQFLIASNAVFDFGHFLSLVRSFSWGDNYPFMSPFVAGEPQIYHFMFPFWVSLFEYFGIPIVWAVGIPSIISYAAFLIMVYWVTSLFFPKKVHTPCAVVVVALTIFQSTLTFWYYFTKNGWTLPALVSVLRISKYFFAGPYDGSVISIHRTLNVFINQRHLGFALTLGLFLYFILAVQVKKDRLNLTIVLLVSFFTGILMLWHMMIFAGITAGAVLLLLFFRKWKYALIYICGICFVGLFLFLPWLPVLPGLFTAAAVVGQNPVVPAAGPLTAFPGGINYWWQNFGLTLVTVPIGFILLKPGQRRLVFPLLILSASLILTPSIYIDVGQKLMVLSMVGWNICSVSVLHFLWQRRWVWKIVAFVAFVILTASGILDFMVIKNDFSYPVSDFPKDKIMLEIQKLPKHAVIVGLPDIFDPITLAGRRNYWGFFRNVYVENRSDIARRMFETEEYSGFKVFWANNVSYIVLPVKEKADFSYKVNVPFWVENARVLAKDDRYMLLEVPKVRL